MKTDQTIKYKNRLINLLKKIKAEGDINDTLYRKMYPTGAVALKFYEWPKDYKREIPLRQIVSSMGTTNYEGAKELARALRPLIGKYPITLRTPRIFKTKSMLSSSNKQNVSLHMMFLHYLHLCLQTLPLAS